MKARLVVSAAVLLVSLGLATSIADSDPTKPSADDLLCKFSVWDGCDSWFARNRVDLLNEKYGLHSRFTIIDKKETHGENGTLVTLHLPIEIKET